MKKYILSFVIIFSFLALSFIFHSTFCFAEDIEIITYYPAPYGVYQTLRVLREGANHARLSIEQYDNASEIPLLSFQKARGSLKNPAAVVVDDNLGRIQFRGYDGSNFRSSFVMQATSTEIWDTTHQGSELSFHSVNSAGNIFNVPALKLETNNNVSINYSNPAVAKLDIRYDLPSDATSLYYHLNLGNVENESFMRFFGGSKIFGAQYYLINWRNPIGTTPPTDNVPLYFATSNSYNALMMKVHMAIYPTSDTVCIGSLDGTSNGRLHVNDQLGSTLTSAQIPEHTALAAIAKNTKEFSGVEDACAVYAEIKPHDNAVSYGTKTYAYVGSGTHGATVYGDYINIKGNDVGSANSNSDLYGSKINVINTTTTKDIYGLKVSAYNAGLSTPNSNVYGIHSFAAKTDWGGGHALNCYSGYFDGPFALDGVPTTSDMTDFEILVRNTTDKKIYRWVSSEKYKENIKPLTDNFNKILEAEPKTFTDKQSRKEGFGYIAEELDSLGLRKLVNYKDNSPESINYLLLPIYLLEVVKDQQKQIDELKLLVKEKL